MTQTTQIKKPLISVVIPVYKKKEMVLTHLKHNKKYLEGYEIIYVDDASGENISQDIKDIDPSVICLVQEKNKGFAPTVNHGCKIAQGKYIMLLNSDVKLFSYFPSTLTKPFEKDPSLFAISFKQKEKDGEDVGKNKLFMKDGFLNHSKTQTFEKGENSWAEGGSCIIRKEMFDALGGFEEIYKPFYWEDIDLSYRAKVRGWNILFDSDIVVEHHHESTIASFYSAERMKAIAFRNQLYFIWLNIQDKNLRMNHFRKLPLHLVYSLFKKQPEYVKGFLQAVVHIPYILKRRKELLISRKVSDLDVLDTE